MVRPKKHLGQHFLTDHNIARKIVEQIRTDLPILEIGPGKGMLSRYLLEKEGVDLYLVEYDREAVEYLQQAYPQLGERLHEADFLTFPLPSILPGKCSIIGNFPYNISSQIFFKVLEHRDQVIELVGMVQREVAQRIIAGPGSKTYGILSVLLQTFYQVEYLFTVGEKVFYPPPNVQSAVIRFRRNERASLPCSWALYLRLVKTAFNQRRKTLRNALKPMLPEGILLPGELMGKRAEALGVEEYIHLASLLAPSASLLPDR